MLFKLEDFNTYQWMDVLEKVNSKQCKNYHEGFSAKSKEYELCGDVLGQEIFKFLSEVTSIVMNPLGLSSTSIVEVWTLKILSEELLNLLRELLIIIIDPEMQARIADILWIDKRDSEKARPIKMAKMAVGFYLQSAKNLESTKNWNDCSERIHRAAQLAPLVDGRKSSEMCKTVILHIEDLIDRYTGLEEEEFLTGSAMEVLQTRLIKSLKSIQNDFPNYSIKYAKAAAKKAEIAENFQDHTRAYYQKMSYRKIEAEWYKLAGEKEAERNTRLNISNVEVWYAEQAFIHSELNCHLIAAGRISSAIKVLNKIEDVFGKRQDTSRLIQDLHKKMLVYQEKSMSKVPLISLGEVIDINDSETQNGAINIVKGKLFCDALSYLAFEYNLIDRVEDLHKEAQKRKNDYPISHLLPKVYIDTFGKTKAVSGSAEEATEENMFDLAKFHQSWYGINIIAPTLKQINSEHKVQLQDLSYIVYENPFIPEGHEDIYKKGLLAGMQGDMLIAAHLLVPQIENSLRYILRQKNIISSNLTSSMIQDEYTLNKILDLPDLKEILNKSIVFTLKCLLVERMGSNIRNEMCHGLLNHNHFSSSNIFYFWWLTLYLCLFYKNRGCV
jgi:Domain of unknown function (DUF4209)